MATNPPDGTMRVDLAFCKNLMVEAHKLLKQHYPAMNLKKDIWVYSYKRNDQWEGHVKAPERHYWSGRAANGYDARYKTAMDFLKKMGKVE